MRIEKLKATYDITTKWVHFPLHPDTPAEGRAMAEFYAERKLDPEAMYQRMKTLMDAEGLPYSKRTHTYNSRFAQELGAWADTLPNGEPLHDALYRTYFVDTRNLEAFEESHMRGALPLPLEGRLTWPEQYEKTVRMLIASKKTVVTYCA